VVNQFRQRRRLRLRLLIATNRFDHFGKRPLPVRQANDQAYALSSHSSGRGETILAPGADRPATEPGSVANHAGTVVLQSVTPQSFVTLAELFVRG